MHVDTYVDDHFEDHDIVVTVPEKVELSEEQRRVIVRVAESLDNEVCFALIDDQTCVMLPSDDGRYGFEYFTSCVNHQIEDYDRDPIDIRLGYIGDGEGLPVVYDDLIRLIFPAYCPEVPAVMRERDIPVDAQLQQREKVREACAEYLAPLAMVMPKEPLFHEEYDERKAAWTEEGDYYEEDEYYDAVEAAKEGNAGVTLMYRKILHRELAAVTELDEEESWTDMEDLREEMLRDLWTLDVDWADEVDGLASGAGASDESYEALIAAIKEKHDHARSIRERAFETIYNLRLGDTVDNDDLVEEIRRYYSRYITLETGSKAVRLLLERDGFDPERDIEEATAMMEALRKDSVSMQDGSGLQRDLANLESIYGLFGELLETEEAERRAAEEEAKRQRMQLRAGNTLLVNGGPLEGRSVLVKEVDPQGHFAIVELEMLGRKVSVKIDEGDLRHS